MGWALLGLAAPGLILVSTATATATSLTPQVLAAGEPVPGSVAMMSDVAKARGIQSPPQAVLDMQSRLSAAVATLLPTAAADPAYTGVWVDPDAGVIRVYEHGSPGAALSAGLAQILKQGLGVVSTPSKWSRAELNAAQSAIVKSPLWGSGGVNTVIAPPDGSGLEVDVDGPLSADQQASLQALVKVDFHVVQSPQISAATRQADTSPFWAGDRLLGGDGTGCTSGWSVQSPTGHKYTLTASHCGVVGSTWFNGNHTAPLGTLRYETLRNGGGYDAALIDTNPNGGSAGRAFYGAWNDPNGANKGVGAPEPESGGEYRCTSGSYSGDVCNGRVSAVQQPSTCEAGGVNYFCYKDFVEQQAQLPIVGQGDSGGPSEDLSGGSTVLPAGVVISASGGQYATSYCAGIQGRSCAWRAGTTGIYFALSHLNVTIITG
jgi:hypothetical protein